MGISWSSSSASTNIVYYQFTPDQILEINCETGLGKFLTEENNIKEFTFCTSHYGAAIWRIEQYKALGNTYTKKIFIGQKSDDNYNIVTDVLYLGVHDSCVHKVERATITRNSNDPNISMERHVISKSIFYRDSVGGGIVESVDANMKK